MERELCIGIVGAGGIVRSRHMPNLQHIEGVKVVAVANRSRRSGEHFAQEFDIPTIHDDWRDLVIDQAVDIVWVGTWPYMHAEVTEAALNAGKHVFCQARMAGNLHEALRMVSAARHHPDQVTVICPPPHGMAGDTLMRQMLQRDNYCGKVLQVRLTALTAAWLDEQAPMTWRKDERLSGLNIMTLGIYVEVLHRWLGYHESVMADFDLHIPRRADLTSGLMRDVVIPDAVRVLARYESGAAGMYHISGLCRHAPDETLEIYGTDGTIIYNFTKDQILAAPRDQSCMVEVPLGPMRRDWTVERDFIHAVRTGDRSRATPTFEEGLRYMEFLEAVWQSYSRREEVRLPVG